MTPTPPFDLSGGTLGPVRWALQAFPAGSDAETQVAPWLAAHLPSLRRARETPALLVRDRFGKPRFAAPYADHDANWSHSGPALLVGLGRGIDVGVDLEQDRPRPRALALARRFFSPPEAEWVGAHPPGERSRIFLRLWCAKEAILKAHGRGLAFGLHRLRLREAEGRLQLIESDPALGPPGAWQLREFVPAPGFLAAIAWRRRAGPRLSQP